MDITYNETSDIICSLRKKPCPYYYGINMKVIKSIINIIISPLKKIIIQCLQEGELKSF